MSLYDRIGENFIHEVITDFYERAFQDPIIGHFFRGKDRAEITLRQIDFATALLGGPKRYNGRPLEAAHEEFSIKQAHFDRRQTLLREVLTEYNLDLYLMDDWLTLEDKFRHLIVTVKGVCQQVAIS